MRDDSRWIYVRKMKNITYSLRPSSDAAPNPLLLLVARVVIPFLDLKCAEGLFDVRLATEVSIRADDYNGIKEYEDLGLTTEGSRMLGTSSSSSTSSSSAMIVV